METTEVGRCTIKKANAEGRRRVTHSPYHTMGCVIGWPIPYLMSSPSLLWSELTAATPKLVTIVLFHRSARSFAVLCWLYSRTGRAKCARSTGFSEFTWPARG
jgi:hypothetical protein